MGYIKGNPAVSINKSGLNLKIVSKAKTVDPTICPRSVKRGQVLLSARKTVFKGIN